MVQVAAQVVTGATCEKNTTHTKKLCYTGKLGWYMEIHGASRKKCVYVVLRSKKQEMVGLLTPKVVVTDLSSFLSSILLCGRKRRKQKETNRKKRSKSRIKITNDQKSFSPP